MAKRRKGSGSRKKDSVNCPCCGTLQKVALDTDKIRCQECDYEIVIGESLLPLSSDPRA